MKKIVFALIILFPVWLYGQPASNQLQSSHSCGIHHENEELFYSWDLIIEQTAKDLQATEFATKNFISWLFDKSYLNMKEFEQLVQQGKINNKLFAQKYWNLKVKEQESLYNSSAYQNYLKEENKPLQNILRPRAPCNNLDFATGDFSGWTGKWNNMGTSGTMDGGTKGYGNLTINGINNTNSVSMNNVHAVCNGGNDPNVPISRVPPGHTYSARIGNDSAYRRNAASPFGASNLPYNHQTLRNTFMVTAANKTITYWYAVVLSQNYAAIPHPQHEQPFFKIRMYDASGNIITCATYDVNATTAGSIGGFQKMTAPSGQDEFLYKGWTPVLIPLINYVGQQVTIEFESCDCARGGHFGYAYFAVDCAPFSGITVTNTPCTNQYTLTAPPGLASYSWSGSSPITGNAQQQTVTVNAAGSYTVTMTTLGNNGTTCTFKLDTTIVPAPPLATASFKATEVCKGATTAFTDNSTLNGYTISSVNWSFGDGQSSTQNNPVHQYVTDGTYQVIYTINLSNGCTYKDTATVKVLPLPVASFNATNICQGQPTQFNNTSTNANTYNWNFGVAGATSAQTAPTYTYANVGSYTVSLVAISSGGCSDTVKNTIKVLPVPQMTAVSPAPVCSGATIPVPSYTTNPQDPAMTFSWTNTNTAIGLPASGLGIPPSFTAGNNTGTTNLTGVVNITPQLNGCSGSPAAVTITILPSPMVFQPKIDLCPGQISLPVNLTSQPATTPNNISWTNTTPSNNIGLLVNSGTGTIPSFTALNNGAVASSIIISVTATLNSCTGPPTSFSITVNPKPKADFTFSRACEGNAVNFKDTSFIGSGSIAAWGWDFNNDGTLTDAITNNPVYTFSTSGNQLVSLEVTSDKGCKDTITKTVYVNPAPRVNFTGDSLGCTPFSTKFRAQASVAAPQLIKKWVWDFGNGVSSTKDTTGTNPIAFNSGTVIYTNGTHDQNISYTVKVTVYTDLGCSAYKEKNKMVTVYPQPLADFDWESHDADIIDPNIQFYSGAIGASGPKAFYWHFGDVLGTDATLNESIIKNPSHQYSDQIPYVYQVKHRVQNKYGCADSIVKDVTIRPAVTFYIPNAFTPNNDGKNEGFKGSGIGIDLSTYKLRVFERWGQEIFYTEDIETAWDGTFEGRKTQQDTYVWKVQFRDVLGRFHQYHGIVTLVR